MPIAFKISKNLSRFNKKFIKIKRKDKFKRGGDYKLKNTFDIQFG